jgi:Trypsin-co-occurring domain 1
VRQLVEFPLEEGGSVFVEVDDRDGTAGYVRAARPGDLAARAEETFDAALGVVRSVATGLVGQVREMGSAFRPDEVEVQFGITFSGRVGAVIATTEGEAQLTVTLRWTPSPDPG